MIFYVFKSSRFFMDCQNSLGIFAEFPRFQSLIFGFYPQYLEFLSPESRFFLSWDWISRQNINSGYGQGAELVLGWDFFGIPNPKSRFLRIPYRFYGFLTIGIFLKIPGICGKSPGFGIFFESRDFSPRDSGFFLISEFLSPGLGIFS